MTFNYVDYNTINLEGKRFYHLGGDVYYPSITTMLGTTISTEKATSLELWKKRVGSKNAKKTVDDACDRGTSIHTLVERFLKNEDLKEHEFKPEHLTLFKSLKYALKRINKTYGLEVVLYSHILSLAGRCDFIGEFDNIISIVDYKTSTRIKNASEIEDYWLQATFYALAHNEIFGTDIRQLVILMGVENHLPMIFKKSITDELILKLSERQAKFYDSL